MLLLFSVDETFCLLKNTMQFMFCKLDTPRIVIIKIQWDESTYESQFVRHNNGRSTESRVWDDFYKIYFFLNLLSYKTTPSIVLYCTRKQVTTSLGEILIIYTTFYFSVEPYVKNCYKIYSNMVSKWLIVVGNIYLYYL